MPDWAGRVERPTMEQFNGFATCQTAPPIPSPSANPVCPCRATGSCPRGKTGRRAASRDSADRTAPVFPGTAPVGSSVSLCSTTSRSPFFSSGTPATTKVCSVAPASSCSFSSTLMCGTISPPILLNRLRRSVICRKPSSSMAAMSPVHIPAVAQHFGGFFRLAQIALHHVRPAHEQQTRLAQRQVFLVPRIFRVDDAHAHAGQRMADFAALGADLPETRPRGNRACSPPPPAHIRCSRSLRAGGCRIVPRTPWRAGRAVSPRRSSPRAGCRNPPAAQPRR